MRHDQIFKQLLSTFFHEFLQLFAPELARQVDPGSLRFLDPQSFSDLVEGKRTEADLVVEVQLRDQPLVLLVHLEHQAQKQAHFGERMFRYYNQLRARFRKPLFPIALFSYSRPRTPEPNEYVETLLGEEFLRFRFLAIQLNQLDWRDFLRNPNPVAAALMSRMQIGVADRPRVKLECLKMLVRLELDPARSHFIGDFFDRYLILNPQEQHQLKAEVETLAAEERKAMRKYTNQWVAEGMAKGEARGLAKGEARGVSTTQRRYVLAMLPRLFGPEGDTFAQHLKRSASEAVLNQVAEALLAGAELEELRQLA